MELLERFIPSPRLLETDGVDLAIPPERAWELVRHGDLGRTALIRALFAIRTMGPPGPLGIDQLVSTAEKPGFRVLAEDPGHIVVVGAIGKVWKRDIPFVHLAPEAFAAFAEPDYVKVAWAIEVAPLPEHGSRVTLELRVDATDARAWKRFRRYFRVIGPGSRFIRKSLLAALAKDRERTLPGDDLLPDANADVTDSIVIEATPEQIWPWLVQLGCRRAGYYSWDLLDNAGKRSAREIHPELQHVEVGDVLPATPRGEDGFEVLAIEPARALVLGGLFDADAKRQLAFDADRPERFWHVTWTLALEPLGERRTRLYARGRVAYPKSVTAHALWMKVAHRIMQSAQLAHLKKRVEGRLSRDDVRDVLEGAAGAGRMIGAMLTPFRRESRKRWGLTDDLARRVYPGDDVVTSPRWSFTHGVEIDAPAELVWPWVAQIGQERGGFYSYQFLENLAGCDVRNAEAIHPEWAHHAGDALVLHPKGPRLVVGVEEGRYLLAMSPYRPIPGKPWVNVTWLFYVEPLGTNRCRLVSRYRCATSDDLATRVAMGPVFVEPIAFAMDRKMLLGIKARAEQRARSASPARRRRDLPRAAHA